ncbi:MAG: peptidoglycan bridge formation glycyltransferase FemA/FemB family protein [Abditibacteriota bacterium]|nr:peptidoglycan bridge formation glycyltransferase FemA/FemB family protein [Abditibacteriota bacterium]
MKISEITDTEKDIFNNFIAWFPWGDLLQSWEWGELKSKSGWTPIRLLARDDTGEVCAAASILKKPLPFLKNRCIFYIPRGFVMDTIDRDRVTEFTGYIRGLARKHGAILVKIDPPIEISDSVSLDNLRSAGFREVVQEGFGGTQPKCVMQLMLTDRDGRQKSLDDIFGAFKEKWRYNIRLSARRGVTARTDCTKEDLPVFYELLKETCERDGFLVRGYEYFSNMWDLLEPQGYLKLFLTYYEGTPVTGSLCYLWGDKAMYTYGASSNSHRKHMPNHLMQWEMIKWAHANNCRIYDFRGVSPQKDGEDKLSGLNRFKEGFSPEFIEYIGEYDLVIDPFLYGIWVKLLPRIRGTMKAMAGSKRNA